MKADQKIFRNWLLPSNEYVVLHKYDPRRVFGCIPCLFKICLHVLVLFVYIRLSEFRNKRRGLDLIKKIRLFNELKRITIL